MFKRMWAALPLILVLVLPAFGQTPAKDRTSNFRVVALQAGQGPTRERSRVLCRVARPIVRGRGNVRRTMGSGRKAASEKT